MIKKILLLMLLPFYVFAHGGEDHNAEKKVAPGGLAYFSSESLSDKYELLIKYKTIPVGKEGSFKLFVSNFETNQAIETQLTASVSGNTNIKLTVLRLDTGVYEIKGIFPEKKKYNISINLNSALGADLLLIKDIEVGKELISLETSVTHKHWYSRNLFFIIMGIIVGMTAMFILMKRRNKRIATMSIIILLLLPTAASNNIFAHGGEDHGDGKGVAKSAGQSNTFTVEKETQFLFDILTQKITIGIFDRSIEVLGKIVPSPKGLAVIQSPQTGKIVSINTTVGQRVSAGQVLAVVEQQIDAGTQISILSQKNAVEAEYNAAKAQYDRLKGIADIVAKKDLTEARARFETAAKNKMLFNANAGGNLKSTKMVTLTSPINGIVGTFNYSMGAVVSAGQTLFEITNLDKVFIEAQVFSNDAGKLKNVLKITATSNNQTDTTAYNVKFVSTAQEVNPDNQSQIVLFEVTNANGRFKIGENINVQVYSGDFTKALVIPDEAITEVNGKPAVFIKDRAEQYSISYVNKGATNGKQVNILKGLEEGERVVTTGVYQMKTMFLNQ